MAEATKIETAKSRVASLRDQIDAEKERAARLAAATSEAARLAALETEEARLERELASLRAANDAAEPPSPSTPAPAPEVVPPVVEPQVTEPATAPEATASTTAAEKPKRGNGGSSSSNPTGGDK